MLIVWKFTVPETMSVDYSHVSTDRSHCITESKKSGSLLMPMGAQWPSSGEVEIEVERKEATEERLGLCVAF